MPDNEFFELLAREALGELPETDTKRIDAKCASAPELTRIRERFVAIMRSAPGDDTADAPASSLHQAYEILRRQLDSVTTMPEKISILKLVYDSLRPVAGLRSSVAGGRRQLMLEEGEISVDVFIDPSPIGHTIGVMVEGDNSLAIRVHSVETESEAELAESEGQWRGPVEPGRVFLEIRLVDRVLRSESFEIG